MCLIWALIDGRVGVGASLLCLAITMYLAAITLWEGASTGTWPSILGAISLTLLGAALLSRIGVRRPPTVPGQS